MSKISLMTELAEVPATGDEVAVRDISDNGTVATGVTKRVSRKNFLGYTEYVALLTQTGTSAPTATGVKNDTGATVSYGYSSQGVYTITFSSAVLTANKTISILGQTGANHYSAIISTTSLIVLSTANASGSAANALLVSTPVIIRIYV